MRGFLERFEDPDREAAEARDIFGSESGSDAAAILVIVPIDDVMDAFDPPVAAVDGQHPWRRGLVRRATGDSQRDLTRALPGLLREGFTLDQKDLPDVREIEVRLQRRTAPDAPRLHAPVIGRGNLDEVGGAARLEQERDLALQAGLVPLDGEILVRVSFDDVAGECALGQPGIARDVLAGEGTALQQRDRQADFVGALLLLTPRYGECTDFFGV